MTKTISKKSSTKVDPTPAEEVDPTPALTEESEVLQTVEFLQDEEAGTVTGTLECGLTFTLKEPKTKDFIRFTSRIESAPRELQTGTMATFWLTHLMITSVTRLGTDRNTIPTFDEFMDLLEDGDAALVVAMFQCFPDVIPRFKRLFDNIQRTG